MPDLSGVTGSPQGDRLDRAYRILSGDDSDERACSAIPESACTELPRNYVLNVLNGAASKLSEQVAGPNLVIPWLLAAIGTPAVFIGFLMPLKQAGSLIPQMLVSGAIRRLPRRKWVWVGAGTVQALALVLVAVAALLLPPLAAGAVTLVLILAFSIASGTASVAFQDVMGKTVPKGQRGGLLGNRATIGGALAVAAGAYLQLGVAGADSVGISASLLAAGGVLWLLAAAAFAAVREDPGATEGGRNLISELRGGVGLLARYGGYRRFLLARIVLLVVEISMPFYALHAQSLFGGDLPALGVFVLTVGLANVLSSRFLGRLADRNSRGVMALASGLAVITAVCALAIGSLGADGASPYLYALVFILLGFAEQGVRLGRKTYLVDAAPSEERPLFVAFANTAVGVFALGLGFLGVLADAFSPATLVAVLGLLGVLGLAVVAATPPAERMVGDSGA
ncbi:MFS transporter [Ectothiorhodospiraceae bacterium WFHF3C12]|nr:MFS transporter [Ectothiorhodospiraceae bacterium WFHF3C12]